MKKCLRRRAGREMGDELERERESASGGESADAEAKSVGGGEAGFPVGQGGAPEPFGARLVDECAMRELEPGLVVIFKIHGG